MYLYSDFDLPYFLKTQGKFQLIENYNDYDM